MAISLIGKWPSRVQNSGLNFSTAGETGTENAIRVLRVVVVDVHAAAVEVTEVHDAAVRGQRIRP